MAQVESTMDAGKGTKCTLKACQTPPDSHAVNVVLLGVAACKEEVGDRGGLVWAEGVHARCLPVQRLPNLDNAVPCWLQALG